MKILYLLVLSGISALFYRLGGKEGYNTKIRDLGCPLIALIALWFLVGFKFSYWWAYLLFFGLSFGALTTYWDFITGKDNFYLHGLGCGLASVPLLWCSIPIWAIIGRAAACAILMGLWSKFWGNDTIEEMGRGFIFTATISLLL